MDCSYEEGEAVFLRVRPKKSSIIFGKGSKLSPQFVGTFEILEKIGPVAYRLTLPPVLRRMHDVFHVSVLRKYVPNPSHILDWHHLQVTDEGALKAEPVCILDHRTRQLRRRLVDQVKVQWSPSSAIWEDAYTMRLEFPFLFSQTSGQV